MFRRWLIPAAITLALMSCTKRPEYTTGAAVFWGECGKCHKMNDRGGTKGPELTRVFEKHDEEYIRTYIWDPRSIKGDGIMPPAEISEKELSLVVEYLKQRGASHTK